jgi:hypothetical protein
MLDYMRRVEMRCDIERAKNRCTMYVGCTMRRAADKEGHDKGWMTHGTKTGL